jgi:excisionase family DNA binding protein
VGFDQDKPLVVTVNRAKALTGLGHSTIYRLIGDGTLKATKVGKRRLISFESLERLVTTEPSAKAEPPKVVNDRRQRAEMKASRP